MTNLQRRRRGRVVRGRGRLGSVWKSIYQLLGDTRQIAARHFLSWGGARDQRTPQVTLQQCGVNTDVKALSAFAFDSSILGKDCSSEIGPVCFRVNNNNNTTTTCDGYGQYFSLNFARC